MRSTKYPCRDTLANWCASSNFIQVRFCSHFLCSFPLIHREICSWASISLFCLKSPRLTGKWEGSYKPEGYAKQKGDGKYWQLMRVSKMGVSSTEGASGMASQKLVLASQISHPLLSAPTNTHLCGTYCRASGRVSPQPPFTFRKLSGITEHKALAVRVCVTLFHVPEKWLQAKHAPSCWHPKHTQLLLLHQRWQRDFLNRGGKKKTKPAHTHCWLQFARRRGKNMLLSRAPAVSCMAFLWNYQAHLS